MFDGAPFLNALSERLEYVNLGHPQEVMDVIAACMAELVRGLESVGVFEDITEYVTFDPKLNIVKGCLFVKPGTWSLAHQSLSFFILRQGFTYKTDTKSYEYTFEL